MAERKLAALEGAQDGLLFSSGMAAITTTLFAMLSKGAHVVVTDDAYRRTRQFLNQVLRRYGLLVPIGMTLDWVLWRHPTMFGVLEALGVAVVVAAAVVAVVPDRLLPAAAAFTVVGGIVAEHLANGQGNWWFDELLAGKFPIVTYIGFVLVGAAAVRSGRYADERCRETGNARPGQEDDERQE